MKIIKNLIFITLVTIMLGCSTKIPESSDMPISNEEVAPPAGAIDFCNRYPDDSMCKED